MTIWVDADACPNVIKAILFKTSERTLVAVVLMANQLISAPKIGNINCVQVSQGFDEADNEIVRRVEPNDLVITSNIPLAAQVLDKGGQALSNTLSIRNKPGKTLCCHSYLHLM